MKEVASPPQAPLPATASTRQQSENSSTIKFDPPKPAGRTEACNAVVQVDPQPLKISIETSTDWPTVGATLLVALGSTATALLVGVLSYLGQRSQVQSTITNFRHSWMVDLRESLSRFMALAAQINYETKYDPKYLHQARSNGIYAELMQMHTKILLMLDPVKEYTERLGMLMVDIENALRDNDEAKFASCAASLAETANAVLERAWQDIKRDLRKGMQFRPSRPRPSVEANTRQAPVSPSDANS